MGKLGENQLKIWNKHVSKWLGTHHLALEILRDSWRRIGMTGVMNRYEYCANSFGNSNSHIDTIATIVSGSCWQQAAGYAHTQVRASCSCSKLKRTSLGLISSFVTCLVSYDVCLAPRYFWCLTLWNFEMMILVLPWYRSAQDADWQPGWQGQAQQEVLRPPRLHPLRGGFHSETHGAVLRGSPMCERSGAGTSWPMAAGWKDQTFGGVGFESGDPQSRALRIRPRTSWAHAAADFHPRRPPWLQALCRHTWPKWGPSFGTTTTSTRRFYVDKLPLPGKLETHYRYKYAYIYIYNHIYIYTNTIMYEYMRCTISAPREAINFCWEISITTNHVTW